MLIFAYVVILVQSGQWMNRKVVVQPSVNMMQIVLINSSSIVFLVDFPIYGRLFTWYRGYGYSMSRLDRFLLSDNW